MVKWNFLYFNLCLSPLILSLDTTGYILSIFPVKYLYTLIRFLPQLSQPLLVTFINNNFTSMFYALQMTLWNGILNSQKIV